jgi:CBS domain-containing protein
MKISEIMIRQVRTIAPQATLKECAHAMGQHAVNGLVVLDGGRIAGIITKADIFRSILPSYTDIIDDEQSLTSLELIEDRVHKLYDLQVKDLMSPSVMTISSDMPVVKAGSLMILKRIKQVPVADGDKLVGIVTLSDIVNHLLEKVR